MARDKVARRYNEKWTPHSFKVGDKVLYRKNVVSSKALNVSGKMQLKWSAPCVIAKVVNKNNILLANPDTGVVVRRAHVSQLKAYTS
jgi:glutamine cyclotransferase